jgi:hypothetical protein
MTRTWFAQAMRINRAFHGAGRGLGSPVTGETATRGFNDSFFRHPEFNFDGNPPRTPSSPPTP